MKLVSWLKEEIIHAQKALVKRAKTVFVEIHMLQKIIIGNTLAKIDNKLT